MIQVGNETAYTVQEVAKILKLSSQTVRSYINKGRIKAQKIGTAYYIAEENLQSFIKG